MQLGPRVDDVIQKKLYLP